MRNTAIRYATVLALIMAGTGPAIAQDRLDPMTALAGRPAGSNPLDPMTAIRASKDAADTAEGNPEFGGLPDGAGAEETFYQCTACHSTEIIKQQRITDLRWDELWSWMVEEQGMFEPDDETRQIILTYLKTNLSSER
ncbi:cytochrome C-552 [Paracoccus sp. M683]|uniref:cytochrome C-552 n=1 Tax=Paracoccus sp. M683 TaxID=2594268 RepID=UPI00117FE31C|nr:cytochrome C-552 [Paracoccus sp. M683]TRW97357.1 cytochrome C-552 [Paracoccus sp. M683]